MTSASRGLKPKKPASKSSMSSRRGAAFTCATPLRTTGGSGERKLMDSTPFRRFSQKRARVAAPGTRISIPTMATSLMCAPVSTLIASPRRLETRLGPTFLPPTLHHLEPGSRPLQFLHGGRGLVRPFLEGSGEQADRGGLVEGDDGDLPAELGFQETDDLQSRERVPAELEEVVARADMLAAQDPLPAFGNRAL